jgi:type IV pilus assembly protein PilO
MKLSKREKILLIVLGIVLCGFMYYKFVWIPENKKIAGLQEEYQRKLRLSHQADDKDVRLKEMEQEIGKLEIQSTGKREKIAQPLRVPDILLELNIMAADQGISIDSIQFSGNAAPIKGKPDGSDKQKEAASASGQDSGDGLKTLTMSFTFAGRYENCMKLIRYYETNRRLFTVSVLDLQGAGDTCTGSVVIQCYTIPLGDVDFKYPVDKGAIRSNPFQ